MKRWRILGVGLVSAALAAQGLWAGGGHSHGGGQGHDHGDHQGAAHHAAPDPLQAFASHGGVVLRDGDHLFEAVFSDRGVRVYVMDSQGAPASVEGLSGSVLLRGRRRRRTRMSLASEGGASLVAARDLSSIPDGTRTALFTITGLRGEGSSVSVWTRFVRSSTGEVTGAAHAEDAHSHGAGGHGHSH